MNIIIWSQESGIIAVCIPTGEVAIEDVIAKDVPSGVVHKITNVESLPLPLDDKFFDAVRMNGNSLVVDLDAAKTIALNEINNNARIESRKRLENASIGIENSPDDNTWLSIINAKRAAVNNATTIEELRNT